MTGVHDVPGPINVGDPTEDHLVDVGDMVFDVLTSKICKLLRIVHDGKALTVAVQVESDYGEGWRYHWEIAKP